MARERSETIDELAWLDAVCDTCQRQPQKIPALAYTGTFAINELSNSTEGRELWRDESIAILSNDPGVVVGIIDPFQASDAIRAFTKVFPELELHLVVITPHAAFRYDALLALENPPLADPVLSDAKAWGSRLGAGFQFGRVSEITDSLWASGYPVVLEDQFQGPLASTSVDDVLVLARSKRRLWVVSPAPNRSDVEESLLQETGLEIVFCGCPPETFLSWERIENTAVGGSADSAVGAGLLNVNTWGDTRDATALWKRILTTAVDMRASDIHIEPKHSQARIRFRIDGALRTQAPLDVAEFAGLAREVKKTGEMNHNLVGRPQDGSRHILHAGRRFDQRYSVLPTTTGEESIVVRILDSRVRPFAALDLRPREIEAMQWAMASETGMIVVSGPTGSGKTTTLYALLGELNNPSRKLFTIEEPVEKHFEDAVQIGVRPEADWTWTDALKYVLRQDPDVILVGELRDVESAQVATRAANTGHKVLTTTHANDAVGVINRLHESFQIDRQTLSISLRLAVAQRLVPKLCRFCRTERPATALDLKFFPDVEVSNPIIADSAGCPACKGTGRHGRFMVCDFLPIDSTVALMIAEARGSDAIQAYNVQRGFRPLIERATYLLLTGQIGFTDATRFLAALPF